MRVRSLTVSAVVFCLTSSLSLALTLSPGSSGQSFSVKTGETISVNLGPGKWEPAHRLTGVLKHESPFLLRATMPGRERIHYECSRGQRPPDNFWAYIDVRGTRASNSLSTLASDRVRMTDNDFKLYLRSERYWASVEQALKPLGDCFRVKEGYKATAGNRTVVTVLYQKMDRSTCDNTPNATPVLTMVLEGDRLVSVNLKGSRTSVAVDPDESKSVSDAKTWSRASTIAGPPTPAERKVLNNSRIMNRVVALSANGYAPLYIRNGAYYLKHRKTGKVVAVR